MGDKITLRIETRSIHGKKVRQLRRQGITPAVVYGAGMDAADVQAPSREVAKVVAAAGRHTPIHLTGVKRRIALIKSIDYDPTRVGAIRHIAVPVRLAGMGESEAEKNGLVVLQAIEKVEVKALPMDLPEALDVSVLGLANEGDRVTVGDITLPEGVELVEHDDGREGTADDDVTVKDLVIASAYEPSALAAANEAAAGAAESADAEDVAAEQGSDDDAV